MKRKIILISSLLFGGFVTIGGWYIFLMIFNLVPFPEYSILSLVILLCGFGIILGAQLFAGPMIIWDSIKANRREKSEYEEMEKEDCFLPSQIK